MLKWKHGSGNTIDKVQLILSSDDCHQQGVKEYLHIAFFSPLFKNIALLFSIVSMKNAHNGFQTHSVHFS